jgi:YD repeat-containing protein
VSIRLSYRIATAVALVSFAVALTPLGANAHVETSASPAWMRQAATGATTPVGGALTEAELPGASNPSEPYAAASQFPLRDAGDRDPWRGTIGGALATAVNPVTGDFSLSLSDLSLPERGVPLALSLTYNSYFASTDSPFGRGWSFNAGMSLTKAPDGSVTISQENGSRVTFSHTKSGYVAPPRVMASLRLVLGTFVFTRGTHGNDCSKVTRECLKSFFVKGSRPSAAWRLTKMTSPDGGLALSYTSGRLTAVTDPAGRQLTFAYKNNKCDDVEVSTTGFDAQARYDRDGNLARFTNADGSSYGFLYDTSHRLTGIVDPRGVQTRIAYDSTGHVLSITDPGGETDYNRGPAVSSVTRPGGAVSSSYAAAREVVRVDQGDSTGPLATTLFTYDPRTLGPTAVTDPDGHTSHMSYDSLGHLISYTDPLGHTSTRRFGVGVITAEDPLGTVSQDTFDSKARLVSIALDTGHPDLTETTRLHYASSAHPGDVTSVTDAEGHLWRFAYDKFGDRTTVTDPLGDTTTTSYDRMGRPAVNTVGSSASSTTYAYDPEGRLLSTTDPLGSTESFSYDRDGNLVATVAGGHQTSYGYDAAGRWTAVTRPTGSRSTLSYLSDGHVGEVCDDGNDCTDYTYDDLGRPATVTDPLGNTSSVVYSPGGMLLSSTDGNGVTTSYTHDADSRTTGVSYSDGVTHPVAVDYDADGRMLDMTDATGTSSFTYDSLGRLILQANTLTPGVGYAFDRLNHVTKITVGSTVVADQAYDAAGRMVSVRDRLGNATTFSYDAASHLTQTLFPGGDVDSDGYDAAGRLVSISLAGSAASPPLPSGLQRNLLGQITGVTQTGTGQPDQAYTYDSNGRLASVNGSPVTFDSRNNLARDQYGNTRQYDAGDRLVSGTTTNPAGDVNWLFGYDDNGSRTSGATTDGAQTIGYGWDAAGNLTSFADGSTSSETNTYDGFGRRVSTSQGGQKLLSVWASTNQGGRVWGSGTNDQKETDQDCGGTGFCAATLPTTAGPFNPLAWDKIAGPTPGSVSYKGTWDSKVNPTRTEQCDDGNSCRPSVDNGSADVIGEVDAGKPAPPSGPLAINGTVYLYGPDGLPVEQLDSSGHALFFHHDQLGSTRAVTDATGHTVALYSYDPWGNVAYHSGVSVPFGFEGGYTDPVSRLVLFGGSYYDPPTGQFLTTTSPLYDSRGLEVQSALYQGGGRNQRRLYTGETPASNTGLAVEIGVSPYALGGGDPVNKEVWRQDFGQVKADRRN